MTPDTKGALDLLTDPSCRASSCVSEENEYVFAVNNGQSCHNLRGNDVLRHACDKVKLENGNVITSTSMRKYVATVSQLVDMNQSEMEWLAQHMGHDVQVHKDYYRLPQTTLELAVVGNLLMAIDEGRAHQFKGRNLRDISLEGMNLAVCLIMLLLQD